MIRQACLTVGSVRSVLTQTNHRGSVIFATAFNTVRCVTIALAPSSYSEVRDGVVVRSEYLRVAEDLVSEGIESLEGDPDVCG